MESKEKLLERNKLLVEELIKYQNHNRVLKKQIGILTKAALNSIKLVSDQSTQTEFDYSYFTPVRNEERNEVKYKLTPSRSLFNDMDAEYDSHRSIVSPTYRRMSQRLSKRLFESPSMQSESTPKEFDDKRSSSEVKKSSDKQQNKTINVSEVEQIKQFRLRRSVKQPISYKEVPLTVKVRKGFEFFKFVK